MRVLTSTDVQTRACVNVIHLLRHLCIFVAPQFVQLRRSSSQTKNFAKAVVNMADAVRALFVGL